MAALFLVAFLLGGGGQRYGLANLAVQLAALGAISLQISSANAFLKSAPSSLKLLVAASLILPLVQIVPLPYSVWRSLPARDFIAPSLELIGGSAWTALSLDPRRTLLALSGLITPIAILLVGWSVRRDQLVTLAWLFAALGLVTLIIGAFQVFAAQPLSLWVYDNLPTEIVLGTFANRNSTGLFLVGALGFAALAPPPMSHPAALPLRVAAVVLLALAIILTQSRSSLVLSVIPLGLALVRLVAWAHDQPSAAHARLPRPKRLRGRPLFLATGMVALVGTTIAALLVFAPGRLGDTLERFEPDKTDARAYIWQDATSASSRYWPVGVGMGNFDEVFEIDESLEHVSLARAVRAHNDYLELMIEAGIAGLALLAGWAALLVWLSWRARLSQLRWLAWAASAFLLAIAGQSLTDYPLRNQTMLAAAGFSLLILARIGARPGQPPQKRSEAQPA